MAFLGSFTEFAKRVLESAKKGGLPSKDLKKLQNLMSRTGTRNTVLAKGILSALSAGGATEKDVKRFGELLIRAEARVLDEKTPFTQTEKNELNEIFNRATISTKTARWFSSNVDELVAEEISDFISGARGVKAAVPGRKTVRFVRDEEQQETTRKETARERKRMTL